MKIGPVGVELFHADGRTERRDMKKPILDFSLTVHHQLGKVIQMNHLDATMIY